mmetsp:Transcript_42517/g.68861  ORF Transcript_42517/g.68861 Transcript_42517/m.68861 type:complete len:262 (-) Transcript_42517:251-1036(-)
MNVSHAQGLGGIKERSEAKVIPRLPLSLVRRRFHDVEPIQISPPGVHHAADHAGATVRLKVEGKGGDGPAHVLLRQVIEQRQPLPHLPRRGLGHMEHQVEHVALVRAVVALDDAGLPVHPHMDPGMERLRQQLQGAQPIVRDGPGVRHELLPGKHRDFVPFLWGGGGRRRSPRFGVPGRLVNRGVARWDRNRAHSCRLFWDMRRGCDCDWLPWQLGGCYWQGCCCCCRNAIGSYESWLAGLVPFKFTRGLFLNDSYESWVD